MFFIRITDSVPNPDTMPVIKTTQYPWTEGSFRPLMYVRTAYTRESGLFVDFMAFEREPEFSPNILDSSCGAVSLCFDGGDLLSAVADCSGRCAVFRGEKEVLKVSASAYSGDDEQGWYWGVRFFLDDGVLGAFGAPAPLKGGENTRANFYKFQRAGKYSHMGAAAPMGEQFIFSKDNLAPAKFVAY